MSWMAIIYPILINHSGDDWEDDSLEDLDDDNDLMMIQRMIVMMIQELIVTWDGHLMSSTDYDE